MIHNGVLDFTLDLFQSFIRDRGRGYVVRSYFVGRDLLTTLQSKLRSDSEQNNSQSDNLFDDIPVKYFSNMVSDECGLYLQRMDPDLGIVWGTPIRRCSDKD